MIDKKKSEKGVYCTLYFLRLMYQTPPTTAATTAAAIPPNTKGFPSREPRSSVLEVPTLNVVSPVSTASASLVALIAKVWSPSLKPEKVTDVALGSSSI